MPKINKAPEQSPDYLMTVKLIEAFRKVWVEQSTGVEPVLFSRLSVVALTQLSAMLGVDVGMTQEQYMAVCQANFIEAFRKAPKFA